MRKKREREKEREGIKTGTSDEEKRERFYTAVTGAVSFILPVYCFRIKRPLLCKQRARLKFADISKGAAAANQPAGGLRKWQQQWRYGVCVYVE